MEYEVVIGLETHLQLSTKSKMFCGCLNRFGSRGNENSCPICLGMPGVLPKPNKEAIRYAIMLGLATDCKIGSFSRFARKNYFYPDLPKGYQISQYEEPICEFGSIYITLEDQSLKKIGITRIHMEEDAGKLIHSESGSPNTLVDLNRAGTPLLEIVSEPDLRSSYEAKLYLDKLKHIARYLDISDCNMEEGSLRCDANISLRKLGEKKFGTRAEIKNLNSFRFLQKGIEYEIRRQKEILDNKGTIIQETRLYNPDKDMTISMRSKEDVHDYRYFPDPDLPFINVDASEIETIRLSLPELPDLKRKRFIKEYNLTDYDANILISTIDIADYYEALIKAGSDPKVAANWIAGELLRIVKESKLSSFADLKTTPAMMAELISLIDIGKISNSIGKSILAKMEETGESASVIMGKEKLEQISDESDIAKIVDDIMKENPQQVEDFRSGKDKVLGWLVGQVMKRSRGKANPQIVNRIILEKLK